MKTTHIWIVIIFCAVKNNSSRAQLRTGERTDCEKKYQRKVRARKQ